MLLQTDSDRLALCLSPLLYWIKHLQRMQVPPAQEGMYMYKESASDLRGVGYKVFWLPADTAGVLVM